MKVKQIGRLAVFLCSICFVCFMAACAGESGSDPKEPLSQTKPLSQEENNILIAYFTWADNTEVEDADAAIDAALSHYESVGDRENYDEVDATTSASVLAPGNTAQMAAWIQERESNILIVYFSRWGNTDYPDDVEATTSASIVADGENYGTTEYVARMIQENTGGDLHLIRTKEPYPTDFEELRELNHNEIAEAYLPPLVESDLDLSRYDTVFIGYPVWATAAPQAVLSFLNEYDLSGKTVIPFCTHDGYGAGDSYRTIREASHAAESLEGLALDADEVPSAAGAVSAWLEDIGITAEDSERGETAITITIGDMVLDGVLYDTALAQEIKEYFPLTISMSGYGGREYYGGVDFYPVDKNLTGGANTFENGDITYCEAHHNMAVFYAQTDNPVLSVDVIPIGRVTSDLSVFETLDSQEEITFSMAE